MNKLLKKTDVIIIIAIVLAAGLLILFRTSAKGPRTAEISVNGETVERINLDKVTGRTEIRPGTDPETVIVAEDGSIRFDSAGCPDKICVSTGKLYRPGDTAVCLPAGTVITVKGGGFDAVTY